MADLEVLEKYEPVLRFTKSERFFPMDVEHYIELCNIFPSGPQGVVELLSHFEGPLITRLGNLHGGQFYLRFVNDPLSDSDAWIWWAILSTTGIIA